MKRFAALFAVLLIGSAAVPVAAEAQARGCPSGMVGKACRDAIAGRDGGGDRGGRGGRGGGRDDRGDGPGAARTRPPGRDDDGPSERSRPPGRGGNSLGDGWQPRAAEARDGVRGGRLVPMEQVVRNIARSTPGQLLDAGLENRSGRQVYRVRWQTNDGRRIDFIVDAQSGQIIGRN